MYTYVLASRTYALAPRQNLNECIAHDASKGMPPSHPKGVEPVYPYVLAPRTCALAPRQP